jgi:serine/threonine protein kinase
MALAAGTRLGHYEILSPIGAGGMGEVYKAKDIRLNRQVAVKVLPEHVSHDPERKQRFEREAQTIASLDHPHICVLFDVGHESGTDFLVMEYLEGVSLAQRLEKGALPLDEALEYAIQIADALEKAGRKGVIHRDIKPANIMLTAAGVKVLDFGLAKIKGTDSSSGVVLSAMPTQQSVTVSGSILGTIQYMAPEQVEGEEITTRTDIFAFGAVLYEMVTGRKAFKGKSQASLMASILEHQPPPIAELQPTIPLSLDHVIRTCMNKDPDRRWQTFADVAIQLRWIAEHTEERTPVSGTTRSMNRVAIAIAAVLAIALAATLGVLFFRPKPEPPRAVRFDLPLASPSPNQFAISPDGSTIVAITQTGNETPLWVRRLDQSEPQLLKGLGNVQFPFWSPDNRNVGFFADGKLKRIDVAGGPPQTLCDAPNGRGGSWNKDGVIIFASNADGPVFRVSAAGGPATPVTALEKSRQETAHLYPQFLPDGNHFIFLASSRDTAQAGIFAGSLDSKETKRIANAGFKAMYADPGYLLFVRETTLMAQAFDAKALSVSGDPFPVVEKVGRFGGNLVAGFTVSNTGVLAFRSGDPAVRQLSWINRTGGATQSVMPSGSRWDAVLSPDGQRIAFEEGSATDATDIWVFDIARDTKSKLTFDPVRHESALWSPDGSQIAYASARAGGILNLYQKHSGGGGEEKLLLKTDKPKTPESWSKDGKYIIYDELDSKDENDIWALPLFGDGKAFPVIKTPDDEEQGQLSPDSKWIAYMAVETGRPEIYVQSFPPAGAKYQISSQGGYQPRWSRNGKELFFLASGDLMAVDIESGVAADKTTILKPGIPRKLLTLSILLDRNNYDVTADGQRFLVSTSVEAASSPLNVVLNWFSSVKR